jgi:hypothetical protein
MERLEFRYLRTSEIYFGNDRVKVCLMRKLGIQSIESLVFIIIDERMKVH